MTSITEWSHSILSAAQDAAAEVRRVSLDALDAGDHAAAGANLPAWEKARAYAARAAEVFSQAVAREIGRLDGFAHMTELEKLWVTHDPEYPRYRQAFETVKARSAAAPEFFILLRRVWPMFPAEHDEFEYVPYPKWQDVYAAFRIGHEFLAIAHRGHVLACKK